MLTKIFLILVLVALAHSQKVSSCSSTDFTFFNGYTGGENYPEQEWDWSSGKFGDGTDDTFDSFFYLRVDVDSGFSISSPNFINTLVDYTCDVGTTDLTSVSVVRYIYNLTDTIQLRREFYAPRATSWIRIVDTIQNFGAQASNLTLNYTGELGSDEGTTYSALNDYYWVSSDNADGLADPPFSVNAGSPGGQVVARRIEGWTTGSDTQEWDFNMLLAAGEFRSVMHILGQHNNLSIALSTAANVNSLPDEIYTNLTEPFESIINWGLCTVTFTVQDYQERYCDASLQVTIALSADPTFTFDGQTLPVTDRKFSTTVSNGTYTASYQRQGSDCAARTASLSFLMPAESYALSVDTTGAWPVITPTGGWGAPHTYKWEVTSGDIGNLFGSTVDVTVTDAKMCSRVIEVAIPEAPVAGPVGQGVPVTDLAAAPGKVSGASQVAASMVLLAALFAL